MVLKIVTSVYELNYEDSRGGMVYKSYPLLTQTLRNIIFEGFEYVIYTNKYTYDKYRLGEEFNKPNITIKFRELDSDYYLNNINPIRLSNYSDGEIYERVYCVKNYIEVIFNKLQFLLDECEDDKNIVWIDSGLFGTSCHDRWRDYINVFAHSELFLNKINEKISDNGFICLRGESIQVNYELKDVLVGMFNTDFKLVPGGLFGGDGESIKKVLSNYLSIFEKYYTETNKLISEQEVLSILTHTNDVKFFNFGDWLDLQKGVLDLMDLLDTDKYKIDEKYDV
jgi:hypothetical protein